jgi:hypothetical protein
MTDHDIFCIDEAGDIFHTHSAHARGVCRIESPILLRCSNNSRQPGVPALSTLGTTDRARVRFATAPWR